MTNSVAEREQEENLREAAAIGNRDRVEALINSGVDVNAQNSINRWTPLHWACKRGHGSIVERLLQHNADVNLLTAKGETCLQLTENPAIIGLLGGNPADVVAQNSVNLPIIPNYLSNPVFPYSNKDEKVMKPSYTIASGVSPVNSSTSVPTTAYCDRAELVLKVRVADSIESDFIEIDVPSDFTFNQLVSLMRTELGVSSSAVLRKVRKLPDTIVRNDRDVRRLHNCQELELVLETGGGPQMGTAGSPGNNSLSRTGTYTAAVTPKRIDVVY